MKHPLKNIRYFYLLNGQYADVLEMKWDDENYNRIKQIRVEKYNSDDRLIINNPDINLFSTCIHDYRGIYGVCVKCGDTLAKNV